MRRRRAASPIALAIALSSGIHLTALGWPGLTGLLDRPAPSRDPAPIEVSLAAPPTERGDLPEWEHPLDDPAVEGLSLDSDDPRYRDYFRVIKEMIARRWVYPEESRTAAESGRVTLRFALNSSGHLDGIRVAVSSGIKRLDRAAFEAVSAAAPFPPRPREVNRDPFVVSALFVYDH